MGKFCCHSSQNSGGTSELELADKTSFYLLNKMSICSIWPHPDDSCFDFALMILSRFVAFSGGHAILYAISCY